MADGDSNKQLSHDTAEALLNAIKRAASDADDRGSDALEHLANAYAAVVGGMHSAPARARGM